jgi:hypothetical protein
MVTIAGSFVDPAARLLEVPETAGNAVLTLPHWIFRVVRAASAAARRLGAPVARSTVNRTPLVHSIWILTHAVHGASGMPRAHPLEGPPTPLRRQRREPSMLAISALHGRPPR